MSPTASAPELGYAYSLEGNVAVPGLPARSGWDARLVNGSASCGLLTGLLEREFRREGHAAARIVVDMLRPIPFAPAEVTTTLVRRGGRLALGDAHMFVGGDLVARASGLFLAQQDDVAFESAAAVPPGPETLDDGVLLPDFDDKRDYPPFQHHCTVRWASPYDDPAPAVWFRPPEIVIEGLERSDVARAVAVADLLAGLTVTHQVRTALPYASAINADQHVVFAGAPRGDWFALRLDRVASELGSGFASADIFDIDGFRGRVTHARVGNRPHVRPRS